MVKKKKKAKYNPFSLHCEKSIPSLFCYSFLRIASLYSFKSIFLSCNFFNIHQRFLEKNDKKNRTVFNINSKSSYDNDFRKIMRDLSNDAKKSDLITKLITF